MNNGLTSVISYTFAALSGICFIAGVTVLSSERRK